jgi:hypothetical protein
MGVFKQFATNRTLEVEGVPIKFAINPDGTVPTIYVRRTYREGQKYQAIFARVTKPYKHEIDRGTISDEDDTRLMQRVCVEASVVRWENMRLPEGVAGIGLGEGTAVEETESADKIHLVQEANKLKDIPFSNEACAKLFGVLPDLWRNVAGSAGDPEAYKSGDLEEMAKNW